MDNLAEVERRIRKTETDLEKAEARLEEAEANLKSAQETKTVDAKLEQAVSRWTGILADCRATLTLLLKAQGSRSPVVDCSTLKSALLTAAEEKGFLCLPGSHVFPVSLKEAVNRIPSKLLLRSFYSELRLILQKLRSDRNRWRDNGGAIFFGPPGTGKSWAGQAVLVDELRDAELSGNAVVYFDCGGKRAFVFSKKRNVLISNITNPNVADIPEMMARDTVLIYDAMRGAQEPLQLFPCECLIFSLPNAGNLKQVAEANCLVRFVCPNLTIQELQLLEHGYGDRFSPEKLADRFDRFGGSPQAVVASTESVSETREIDTSLMLRGVVRLWFDTSAMSPGWPSSMLKARYRTEKTAVTPEEAFEKYKASNVTWEYSSPAAMKMMHAKYDRADEVTRRTFQSWLRSESKASALYGYWFEFKTRSLFASATDEDVEVKVLAANEGLSEDENENRVLTWKMPQFEYVRDATFRKKGSSYDLTDLKKLSDPSVLYRLPQGFPLIDYFNPPNNCFSLGVGEHTIHLGHAVDLCTKVVPATKQVNFVFVTPSVNYVNVRRQQSFDTGSGKKVLGKLSSATVTELSRMVQFCMRFKKC